MSRQKTIQTEELLKYLNEYLLENGGSIPKIPAFGTYLREKGIHINDFTLRRDECFKKYLNELSQNSIQSRENDLVTYKSIDVSAFLQKNNTTEKLKQAISARDQYYAEIARKAVDAINEKKKLVLKNKRLNKEIADLKKELAEAKQNANHHNSRDKDKAILSMKNILNSYIYPDMANALLKKDGVLEIINSVIPDEIAEHMMIQADTNISLIANDVSTDLVTAEDHSGQNEKSSTGFHSIDTLFGGFDK